MSDDRYLIDSYMDWVTGEGVPVYEEFSFDMRSVVLAPWARFGDGVSGAFTHLRGRGDFASAYVLELAPGAGTSPQKHLYEEVVYVLSGNGSTVVQHPNGHTHTFEWQQGSLFALPLNARYEHFNVSGETAARMGVVTNLPLVLNVFHNESFVFDNDFRFEERFGPEEFFGGEGRSLELSPGRHQWVTNFVADLPSFELKAWSERGIGSSNIKFVLADGTMHCHMSELAVGTYKKGHRHGPDFHIFPTTGEGYSLFWYEGDQEFTRVDWGQGSMYAPADQQFHQHFNLSPQPSRYLAVAMGSIKYPVTTDKRTLFGGQVDQDVKRGGRQIEYRDENPRIREMFEEELKLRGLDVDPRLRAEWAKG
jgi:mannose-6-phosphate isomerase-like protein (cupin superfamily)